MKTQQKFDEKKALYDYNDVYIARLLDPYTVKIAKVMHNLGFTPNLTTLITFFFGMLSIFMLLLFQNYFGIVFAAILIFLRNIGDTVDGKIARGTGNLSGLGGFLDIITDWLFFHALFFITVGVLTNHLAIGFLCVTGYMSREFTRRKFTEIYGIKITETKTAKKLSGIVSVVRKYDLGSSFWLIPLAMILMPLFWIILFTAVVEYSLLFGEFALDIILFLKNKREYKPKKKLMGKI